MVAQTVSVLYTYIAARKTVLVVVRLSKKKSKVKVLEEKEKPSG